MSAPLIEEQSLTAMQQTMSKATDGTVARIVALVDAMPERGEADALIEKMRPRLAHLPVPRPMRLSRLFYMPLDALIVPADRWRRGALTIPRQLLPHLTRHLEREFGPRVDVLAAMLREAPGRDDWALHELGRAVWAEASAMLLAARFSAEDIAASGFTPQDHQTLTRAVARVLGLSVTLRDLAWRTRCDAGPPAAADVRRCLEAAQSHGKLVFGMVLTLAVELFPAADFILGSAEQIATTASLPAVEQVAERSLEAVGAALAPGGLDALDPQRRPKQIERLSRSLAALERSQFGRQPNQRATIAALRQRLEADRLAGFRGLLDERLLAAAGLLTHPIADADIGRLEAAARALRRMELAARASPHAPECRRLLDAAASRFAAEPGFALARGDRMRLVEILCDADTALRMFRRGPD